MRNISQFSRTPMLAILLRISLKKGTSLLLKARSVDTALDDESETKPSVRPFFSVLIEVSERRQLPLGKIPAIERKY